MIVHSEDMVDHPCPCGSGKESYWEYDARGIPLHRACEMCRESKRKKFRSEVLTDPNYDTYGDRVEEL